MEETKKKKRALRFPITVKTVIMIVVFGMVLAEIAMIYFSIVSNNNNKQYFKDDATELSSTVALSIDKNEVKEVKDFVVSIYDTYTDKPTRDKEGTAEYDNYMKKVGEVRNLASYKSIQSYLHGVKDVNKDTDGVYVAYVDYANKLCVYLVYDQENEIYPVGVVDALYEEDYPLVDDHMLGFVASIYESENGEGMLCTAGAPIVDDKGDVIGYALVDISMATIRSKQASSIVRLFLYLVATVVLLTMLGMLVVHFTLIKPVKTLQQAAKSYDVNEPEKTHEKFVNLKVNTHDEFSDLAENMRTMENDINTKISELVKTNDELVQSQRVARTMTELANKDGLTGVKNKLSYQKAIEALNDKIAHREEMQFGIAMVDLNYLKQINDEFGHNSGDAALVKLCNLICAIFAHSPVYRVGGDEFVVLLRNRDYHRADELIAIFNNKIDELWEDKELPLYERISAAIGYAKYDIKKHNSAEDVFKDADSNMYIRKRDMKQHQQLSK